MRNLLWRWLITELLLEPSPRGLRLNPDVRIAVIWNKVIGILCLWESLKTSMQRNLIPTPVANAEKDLELLLIMDN